MLKVLVDYPSDREELVIVERMARGLDEVRQIISADKLLEMQKEADAVYVDPQLMEYAVQIVGATRRPADYGAGDVKQYIAFGASPRASINLVLGARALAMLRGRDYVVPGDIADLTGDVMRHRIVLSYEALADNVSADAVIRRIMEVVARPARPMMESIQGQATEPGLAWRTA
jgi:MoxR-like ATPase